MYEIYDADTNKVLDLEWTETDAADIAHEIERMTHADVSIRYIRHHACDFVPLFDEMEVGQAIDLYRQGHRQPSLTVKRTGDEWSIEINGLSVPFDETDVNSWAEDDLVLYVKGNKVATIELIDQMELERF